jgi:hypothetical protein
MNEIADCTQLDLPWRTARKAPTPDCTHVRELIQLLRGRGWVKAKEICALRPDWWDKEFRYLRVLASASEGEILSGPGCPGYCLTREHLEEVPVIAARIRHQRNEMDRRLIEIQRFAHDAVNGKEGK